VTHVFPRSKAPFAGMSNERAQGCRRPPYLPHTQNDL
jgi:hypothetical protein